MDHETANYAKSAGSLCLIVSGGDYCGIPDDLARADYVIACDHGWQHAQALGLVPDLIVGDFDSSPCPDTGIPVWKMPSEKDDTDTMLAVRHALSQGYRDIAICCAFGGRLDHTLANIQSGAYIAARKGRARLLSSDTDALIFTGGCESFPRRKGWSLSVFALSDRCSGITIQGTKYQCENGSLENAFPLGVSNVWTEEEAVIRVSEGILMVMQSRLRDGEHI